MSTALPPVVTHASLDAAMDGFGPGARLPGADPEVRHLAGIQEQLGSDPAAFLRMTEHAADQALRTARRRDELSAMMAELVRLMDTAGLAAYACGEAMHICLADMAMIEVLEEADVPAPAIQLLSEDLPAQSVDLVARLIRNMALRARADAGTGTGKGGIPLARAFPDVRALPDGDRVRQAEAEPVLVVPTAGRGTRLRSTIPKALVPVSGIPMIARIVAAATAAGLGQFVFVLKFRADTQLDYLARWGPSIVQDRADGNGHSSYAALTALRDRDQTGPVLLSYSDLPFVRPGSFRRCLAMMADTAADLVLSTVAPASPAMGRVMRDTANQVSHVAQPRLGERGSDEGDAGLYAMRADRVVPALSRLRSDDIRGEYHLTDLVAELTASGGRVSAVPAPAEEFLGVNTPAELKQAELRAAGRPLDAAAAELVCPACDFDELHEGWHSLQDRPEDGLRREEP